MNEYARPDPDVLLKGLRDAEVRRLRGKLKIFLGFAPGVGKTWRMLQVARDLVTEQELDVVVGIVEDHGRAETARMALGLELLPRRKIEHRGKVLLTFDLDAALARRPKLILVDELAHTNIAGARHPKRWQDVEELLVAGVDVFTTMNVQHIESLNDVVAQITRVQVRETVPDSVLDRADAIELIDIAPEELLARLYEGKVYLPEQARRAAQHFFQRGNLLALRELALRRAAQHVDDDVRAYRAAHGVADTWPAGERILVCVGPAPSSGRLIRSGARMAAGLRCPWVAACVEADDSRPLGESARARLEAHLRHAEALGAMTVQLTGSSVHVALLDYARKHNITRLIIGKPTHAKLLDRLRGSLLNEIVRGSGDIDVLVIRGDRDESAAPRRAEIVKYLEPAWRYLAAVAAVAMTLALALALRNFLQLPDFEMLFLLAVMVSAVWFGRGPSTVAAALAVALYDYFFVAPLHTFSVADRRYLLTFAMMFTVGFVMSGLTTRLRRQQQGAQAREARTAVLYALTRELSSSDEPTQIGATTARHAADIFSADAVVLGAELEGRLGVLGAFPEGAILDARELVVARWAFEHDALAGVGTDTLQDARVLCAPLRAGASRLGVLALFQREKGVLRADQRAFLDVLCRQAAVALERARLSEEARRSVLRAETEAMRSSLLSAVSHDLRTPLASITGAATSLRDDTNLDEGIRGELVESIVGQAERLEHLVANLLDMTRIDAGSVVLSRDWVPIDEMVGSALTRSEEKLGDRAVTVSLGDEPLWVYVDPVLFEQIFMNLLENAEKYTPAGSPIEVSARRDGDRIEVSVSDHGPGVAEGDNERVFEKFYRGTGTNTQGAGLGLAICKGIAEAHGGTIRATSRSPHGAVFTVSIPQGRTPPELLESEAESE